jgi:hypothetical protein
LEYDHLVAVVSPERLRPYLSEARGSRPVAAELYTWNIEIGAALWELLCYLEVATRNAMARELQIIRTGAGARNGVVPQWYNRDEWFTARQREGIREAKAKAKASPNGATPGRVVAGLMFGFWVSLIDPAHTETLWIPGLRRAFPNSPGGHKEVRGKLAWANQLRNDIAHHNRLYRRPILDVEEELLRAAFWIDPLLADWMATASTVRTVNSRRPILPPTLRWNATTDAI